MCLDNIPLSQWTADQARLILFSGVFRRHLSKSSCCSHHPTAEDLKAMERRKNSRLNEVTSGRIDERTSMQAAPRFNEDCTLAETSNWIAALRSGICLAHKRQTAVDSNPARFFRRSWFFRSNCSGMGDTRKVNGTERDERERDNQEKSRIGKGDW